MIGVDTTSPHEWNDPADRDDFGPETEIDPETTRTRRRLERLRRVISLRQPNLHVVLENVHDKHNVSAVLRSCDAVGVDTVHLLYTIEKFPTIGRASSAGVGKWMTLVHHRTVEDCFERLRQEHCTVLATSLRGEPRSLYSIDLTGPVALVFGNEHRGVSKEVVDRADGTIRIPMAGFVESLNISVACAVTLYEAYRQRSEAGLYATPQLTPEEIESRLGSWVEK